MSSTLNNKNSIKNDNLYRHKTRPTYFEFPNEEHQLSKPCGKCFPNSNSVVVSPEALGVRNLMVNPKLALRQSHPKFLSQFESIQVHQGQIEQLKHLINVKVFICKYKSCWDKSILTFVLNQVLEKPPMFIIKNVIEKSEDELANSFLVSSKYLNLGGNQSLVIFINMADSDSLVMELKNQLISNSKEVIFIPTSMTYEFLDHDPNSTIKPIVRINFGQPHFSKDLVHLSNLEGAAVYISHFSHEIWKGDAIMPFHLISMFNRYQFSYPVAEADDSSSPSTYAQLMSDFRKEFKSSHDFAFVGRDEDVANYAFQTLSTRGPSAESNKVIDLMIYNSIMMKSLILVVDLSDIDYHSETCRISENRVLEKFKNLTRILYYEVDDINPPCANPSMIEKQAMESLVRKSIVSYQSDQTQSEDIHTAKKISNYLDVDLEDEDDFVSAEQFIYVSWKSFHSQKWVANIVDSLIEVYFVSAQVLLDIQKIDVLEVSDFIDKVSELFENIFGHKPVCDIVSTVRGALKLFAKEGLVTLYSHSNVEIVYLNDPLNEENILLIIDDINQLVF